ADADANRSRQIRRGIKCEDRRKLFGGERDVAADAIEWGDQDARRGWNFDAGHFGDRSGWAPDNLSVRDVCAAQKNERAEAGYFIGGEKICVLLAAFFEHLLADGFFGDDRLLR